MRVCLRAVVAVITIVMYIGGILVLVVLGRRMK